MEKYIITVSTDESGATYMKPLQVGSTNNKKEADKIAAFYDGRATITTKNPAAMELGRLGGSVKSEKKSKSSSANGAKGGRPRKTPTNPAE
jgi:hypothetical protein